MFLTHSYLPNQLVRTIMLGITDKELRNTGTPPELAKVLPDAVLSADGTYHVSEALFRLATLAHAIEEANIPNKPTQQGN